MISDKLEQADMNPEKDYHLKMDIRRVLRGLESVFLWRYVVFPQRFIF